MKLSTQFNSKLKNPGTLFKSILLIKHNDFCAYAPYHENVFSLFSRNLDIQKSYDQFYREEPYTYFSPECLTIFFNYSCNLACDYCYASGFKGLPLKQIDTLAVLKAAEYVADHCRLAGKPLVIGFHGPNEPLISIDRIESLILQIRCIADSRKIPCLTYCTTNGFIPEEIAERAVLLFSEITLSCDGPPTIQDRHRRMKNGRGTSAIVEKTMRIFQSSLSNFRIRATVTSETVSALPDIIDYFADKGISHVEVFPMYQNLQKSLQDKLMTDPEHFVAYFLNARKRAAKQKIDLTCSAARWPERHGRYCSLLQKNMVVTTDGFLTNCFLVVHNHNDINDNFIYGAYQRSEHTLHLEYEKINTILNRARQLPFQCRDCFNQLSCNLGCPKICPFMDNVNEPFDCRMQKWLATANVIEAAGMELPDFTPSTVADYFSQWQVCCIQKENEDLSFNN